MSEEDVEYAAVLKLHLAAELEGFRPLNLIQAVEQSPGWDTTIQVFTHRQTHPRAHAHPRARAHTHTLTHTRSHTFTHTHTRTRTRTHACMHARMHACTRARARMHARTGHGKSDELGYSTCSVCSIRFLHRDIVFSLLVHRNHGRVP